MNVEPGLLLIANKKMRIYSSASIAANPMLAVGLRLVVKL